MSIDPTERFANVQARINEAFASMSITGAPTIIFDGQTRSIPDERVPFVRLAIEPLPPVQPLGRYNSTRTAQDERCLIIADLFWPDGDTEDVTDAYAITRAADDIAWSLRHNAYLLKDYSARDGSPTAITEAPLRFVDLPEQRRLPGSDGFSRRQVAAEARWISRHTP